MILLLACFFLVAVAIGSYFTFAVAEALRAPRSHRTS
jgi:hypothetical protein